jgi:hypothetical protein
LQQINKAIQEGEAKASKLQAEKDEKSKAAAAIQKAEREADNSRMVAAWKTPYTGIH